MTSLQVAQPNNALDTAGRAEAPDAGRDDSSILTEYIDVLYVTNRPAIPTEIKRLLHRKRLSFRRMTVDEFPKILHQLALIGTVIIDSRGIGLCYQQRLARMIESLEMAGVGAILLNHRPKQPVKSFSLAGPPVKSFALVSTMETVLLDELWARISVNLAYRKKDSDHSIRSIVTPACPNNHNRLAEKLQITGDLVDNLAEQLQMAGLVQRDFLPARLPDTDTVRWAAVFVPAEWVSGDMYDIARLDEQHFGFYIIDAVGHAMPAALLTIFAKQALVMRETRGENYRIFEPADVMSNLNHRITQQRLSGYQFATCCYCLLNAETLELKCARAGHPYPILIRPGQKPQIIEAQGPLLGIFDNSEYQQQTTQLQKGDKLLIYSDGAEPFIGRYNEIAGFTFNEQFEKLKDLPVGEMMNGLNQLIRIKDVPLGEIDDITALALEIL